MTSSTQTPMQQDNDRAPELDIEGPLARLRLCRPRQHNRLDPADLPILQAHLAQVAANPQVRVLVLTGSGRQTFSSGYTLAAIRHELDDRFERVLDTLEALPIPVIGALNGSVYGGATDLALCCETEARIEHLRESLGVSAEAHRSGALVIAGHADCAANPVSEAQHRDHLRRALSRALTWAPPDMVVVGVWVDDEGRVTEVDASPVPGERVSGPGSEPIGPLAQAMNTPS